MFARFECSGVELRRGRPVRVVAELAAAEFDAVEVQQEITVGRDGDHRVIHALRQGETAAEIRMKVDLDTIRRKPDPAGGGF